MFFGKKFKHRLPKFPASVIPTFKMLNEVLDDAGVEELRSALTTYIDKFRTASKHDVNIDIRDVEELVSVCFWLLDYYPQATHEGKGLIVAGVRYVAVADDPFCDSTFASGFYDDRRVINHVLENLGVEDRYLKLDL